MVSESAHSQTGSISDTVKPINSGFYCTEQGLKNLTDLIKILQDERTQAVEKAKTHAASIICMY